VLCHAKSRHAAKTGHADALVACCGGSVSHLASALGGEVWWSFWWCGDWRSLREAAAAGSPHPPLSDRRRREASKPRLLKDKK